MPEKSLQEMQDAVGNTVVTVEGLHVEAGKVEEFARAVKDDNPVHRSESAAAGRGYDRIPAPLTFLRTSYFPRYYSDLILDEYGDEESISHDVPFELGFDPEKTLHAEQEYEFERPVLVGDSLTGVTTLTDVSQKEGSEGELLTFCTVETEYRDSDGDLVVVDRYTRVEVEDSPSGGDQ